ncbi:MAG TPA: hypothetical protein VMM78_00480, partial [Thermomicrobiales bacterium]|nr:hypothetical protein [Thermomicrobiales bacterium]
GGPALYVPSGKVCFPGRTLTVPRQADSITITDPTIGPTTAVLANFIADTKGIGIAWVDVSAPGRAVLHFTRKLNEDTPILVILFDALPAA